MSGDAKKKPVASEEGSQESRKPPRSLEDLRRLIEADPTADFELSATELMTLMGSPRKDGFCSTPPSQQESFMDATEPDDIRVVACLLQATTKGGTGTRGRTPFARNPDGTALKREHLPKKLFLKRSICDAALDLAIAKGRVREDEQGRLLVCGSVPAPRLKLEGRRKGKGVCTNSHNKYLALCLQQLAESEKRIFEQRQARLDAAEDEAVAEVTAQVREAFAPYRKQLFATIGVKPVTLKKRRHKTPRKEPQLKVTLQLKFPEFDFVQTAANSSNSDFVRTPNPTSYEPKNEFVHAEHPYREESSEFSELANASQSTANPKTVTSELSLAIRETVHRSRLQWLGEDEKRLDDVTVSTIAASLEPLTGEPRQVMEVLDDVEAKCQGLANRPDEARKKTWGWIVGMVRSEVNKRLKGSAADVKDQLKAAAAAKGMR